MGRTNAPHFVVSSVALRSLGKNGADAPPNARLGGGRPLESSAAPLLSPFSLPFFLPLFLPLFRRSLFDHLVHGPRVDRRTRGLSSSRSSRSSRSSLGALPFARLPLARSCERQSIPRKNDLRCAAFNAAPNALRPAGPASAAQVLPLLSRRCSPILSHSRSLARYLSLVLSFSLFSFAVAQLSRWMCLRRAC